MTLKLQPHSSATRMGQRRYQEDRLFAAATEEGFLIGVFDGHGGDEVSHFASEELPGIFANEIGAAGATPRSALENAVQKVNLATQHYRSGSTLSLAFVPSNGDTVHCAVLGDSPILVKDAEGKINVSPDHNVRTNQAEAAAAVKRGGTIRNGYLCDSYYGISLQMARALGDSELSRVLSRVPDIYEVKVGPGSFVLVATDGAFDPRHYGFAKEAEEVVKLVERGADAQAIVDRAVALLTGDNVSAVLVRFEEKQP
jgi:serine/threonine protein phosphatase PrpC